MWTFGAIVGGAMLAAIGLGVAVWLALYLRWLRALGPQGRALARLGPQPVVARASFVPGTGPLRHPDATALVDRMVALGYQAIGVFDVPEMKAMRVWGGYHGDGSVAIVYDHVGVPPWFDLVRFHVDSADAVSNTPHHDPRHVPPGSTVVADPSLEPEAARVLLSATPRRAGGLAVGASNFGPVLAEAYARDMDHMLSLEAPGLAEIEAFGKRGGVRVKLTSSQKHAVVERVRRDHMMALEDALLERFRASGQLSAHEWRVMEDRVVVVHGRMSDTDALSLVLAPGGLDDADPAVVAIAQAHAGDPMAMFDGINALLPAPRAWRAVGGVDLPVPCRIYAMPG